MLIFTARDLFSNVTQKDCLYHQIEQARGLFTELINASLSESDGCCTKGIWQFKLLPMKLLVLNTKQIEVIAHGQKTVEDPEMCCLQHIGVMVYGWG